MPGTADHPDLDSLHGFLAYLRNERRYSDLTIENYARDIRRLLALAAATPLGELKIHHLRRFVAQVHGSGLGGKSLARMLSAWRGFYAYLIRGRQLNTNPCAGLRAPKSARLLPHALSPDEAARMMELPISDGLLAVRDKAMFELFYSSGLRLAELVGLDCAAPDFTDGAVRVTGKGSKTRIVPMGSHAIAALHAWLAVREQLAAPDEAALFVGRNGRRLTPRAVQVRMKEWGIRQGISSGVHPHLLRHSFASHVLQSSGDLRAVQEMLGHASISTTQVYTHLDFQYLSKIYDAAHPRARKKAP
ncbi:MAG: tyrosine recombinase XerC [Nitrosomonadales bacterium]|nr:tyrosine recombinase XerC [Nitrosomonadales bacterium]